MRAGQALGLRHADFVSRRREVRIVPRAGNANGARAKVRSAVVVPVSVPLVRLYSEYMHVEYGSIDSDYVFVNLFAGRVGAAMTYPAVHQLIGRIAARTGIGFTAHMLRHSHATDMVRRACRSRWSRGCSLTARRRRRARPMSISAQPTSARRWPGQGRGRRKSPGERPGTCPPGQAAARSRRRGGGRPRR